MNLTETVITTALLGTSTRQWENPPLPECLEKAISGIIVNSVDKEERFCRIASLAFFWRKAGTEAYEGKAPACFPPAPEEDLPVLPRECAALLSTLVTDNRRGMLVYAYGKATGCGKIIPPFCLPDLISHAFARTDPEGLRERKYLMAAAGKRGRWLASLMGYGEDNIAYDDWKIASHTERKRILSEQRKVSPSEGLELLRTEFLNESAAHRTELLQCLRIGLGKADEPFLEEIGKSDRSANVRNIAMDLLSCIPDSRRVSEFCSLLDGNIKWKLLTGWSYGRPAYTEEMKSLGIEEVSHDKKEGDDKFILRQIAERVPLTFWASVLGCSLEKAAEKLAKRTPLTPFFDVCVPIMRFNDNLWAFHTLKAAPDDNRIANLMGMLTPEQREVVRIPDSFRRSLIPESWFGDRTEEWGPCFSMTLLNILTGSDRCYCSDEMIERIALSLNRDVRKDVERKLAGLDSNVRIGRVILQLEEYLTLKTEIDALFR